VPKLRQSELGGYRDALLARQQGICPVCGKRIEEDGVLDHDHKTGRIRAVLHRGCNRAEGKVLRALQWAGGATPATLRRLASYLEADWSDRPLHPTHKTETDKRLRTLRNRLKVVRAPHAIKRIKAEIRQLNAQKKVDKLVDNQDNS
jgi:hypothetical protein